MKEHSKKIRNVEVRYGLSRVYYKLGLYTKEQEQLKYLLNAGHKKGIITSALSYKYGEGLDVDLQKHFELLTLAKSLIRRT